jgi:hypothetical protein
VVEIGRLDEEASVCFPGSCQTNLERSTTMAEETMALLELLRKGEEPEGDVLVNGMRWLLQELMEAEVSAQIGADRYERTKERTAQRNGYRTRPWDTRLGTLELQIPKLRTGRAIARVGWSRGDAPSRRWWR